MPAPRSLSHGRTAQVDRTSTSLLARLHPSHHQLTPPTPLTAERTSHRTGRHLHRQIITDWRRSAKYASSVSQKSRAANCGNSLPTGATANKRHRLLLARNRNQFSQSTIVAHLVITLAPNLNSRSKTREPISRADNGARSACASRSTAARAQTPIVRAIHSAVKPTGHPAGPSIHRSARETRQLS